MAIDIYAPLGVVCHDAGGANQILAMLGEPIFKGTYGYFEGPAHQLWSLDCSRCQVVEELPELFSRIQTLVTGTGWGSLLEHQARVLAKQHGIRTIAILDHWTNYYERFIRDDELVLPDELWVVDEYALGIARQTFPSVPIVLQPDYYAAQQIRSITPTTQVSGNELLYLLEPARSYWGGSEPGEFQALRYFLDRLPILGLPMGTNICLRPHPSDAPLKYEKFMSDLGCNFVLDRGSLVDAFSRARWVAGCQTYALTLGLRAGRTTYCTLPPWAPACELPHPGLVHLKQMDAI